MSKKKPTEEEILFPDAKVGDIVVKPWAFGKLFEISGHLDRVLGKMEEHGLEEKLEESAGFVPYTLMARIFTLASQDVLEIIASTVGMEEEEVKELDMQTGIEIAVTIFSQNRETITGALKNALSSPPSPKPKKKAKAKKGEPEKEKS